MYFYFYTEIWLLGFVARGVNTFLLEGVSYNIRVSCNIVLIFIGLLGIALSVNIIGNFCFAVSMVVILGATSSFGERSVVFLFYFSPL